MCISLTNKDVFFHEHPIITTLGKFYINLTLSEGKVHSKLLNTY